MHTTTWSRIRLVWTSAPLIGLLALTACKGPRPDDEIYAKREDDNTTCSNPGSTPNGCGCWRWFVKTATDTAATQVSTSPTDTNIAALLSRPAPPSAQLQTGTARFLAGSPYQEVTLYRLKNVLLIGCRSEDDSDYHLILGDPSDPVNTTMVAEIPSPAGPDCFVDKGVGTPFKSQISVARNTFVSSLGCKTTYSPRPVVTVTGIGFWDTPHGQTGGSDNGIELHPVTALCIGQDCGGTATGPFSIGGSISGLSGAGLTLKNAADTISPAAGATGFTFPTRINGGGTYSVAVGNQPTSPWQTCSVANGSGTVGAADVTTVNVACATNSYSIKGTLSGLAGSGLVLHNGSEDLPVAPNATSFQFLTKVPSGAGYGVTVKTHPSGPSQTCNVTSGNAGGTVGGADVSVAIACTTNTYSVGGKALALTGSGLKLQNGAEQISVAPNGGADVSFTFATAVASGQGYGVTIAAQPAAQTCAISGASGTVVAANVTSVVVNCNANSFTIGGTVSGLSGTAILTLNGANDLPVSANGQFAFPAPLANGSNYTVAVKSQPSSPAQTCAVTNASGQVAGVNVSNVAVSCATNAFTIGGTVSGLAGAGLQISNGGDTITLPSSATGFAFPGKVGSGSSYAVTIASQPTSPWQTCTVSGATGSVQGADVTTVAVQCATNTYPVKVALTGLEGDGMVLNLASAAAAENLEVSGFATAVSFAAQLPSGTAYTVAIGRQPRGPDQQCTIPSGAGVVGGAPATASIACTTLAADGGTDAGSGSDGGSDGGADAGPACGPGKHLENGVCVVDWAGDTGKSGCSSAGVSAWALLALVLAAASGRRRGRRA